MARLAGLAVAAALYGAHGVRMHEKGHAQAEAQANLTHLALQSRVGDVLEVTIADLRPTQVAVGYDQIFYHLARNQPDHNRFRPSSRGFFGDDDDDFYTRYIFRTDFRRINNYCADNGMGGAEMSAFRPNFSRLNDPRTFRCLWPAPTRGSQGAPILRTVVIGPGGGVFLTDGHHTFTVLNELADGGPRLPVWVRVQANFADSPNMAAFWQRMEDAGWMWLYDREERPVSPNALPTSIALRSFQDDPMRAAIACARNTGYSNANVPDFAEFKWGSWLRRNGFDLGAYNDRDLARARIEVSRGVAVPRSGDSRTSYPAAIRDMAIRMVSAPSTQVIARGITARELGQLPQPSRAADWNDELESRVWRADVNGDGRPRSGGRHWYAVNYRRCNGAPMHQPVCWRR